MPQPSDPPSLRDFVEASSATLGVLASRWHALTPEQRREVFARWIAIVEVAAPNVVALDLSRKRTPR
jgi:hypothetical protein